MIDLGDAGNDVGTCSNLELWLSAINEIIMMVREKDYYVSQSKQELKILTIAQIIHKTMVASLNGSTLDSKCYKIRWALYKLPCQCCNRNPLSYPDLYF